MGRIESFMQIRWICAVAFLGTALCGGTASAGTKAAPAAKSAPAAKPAPAIKTSNTQRGRDATEGQHPSDNRRGGLAPTKTELQRPGDHQLPNGGKVRTDPKGVQREMDKGGHIRGIESPNMHARMGANGRPESFRVERNGSIQEFHRGPGGLRVVEGRHPAVGGGLDSGGRLRPAPRICRAPHLWALWLHAPQLHGWRTSLCCGLPRLSLSWLRLLSAGSRAHLFAGILQMGSQSLGRARRHSDRFRGPAMVRGLRCDVLHLTRSMQAPISG